MCESVCVCVCECVCACVLRLLCLPRVREVEIGGCAAATDAIKEHGKREASRRNDHIGSS